MSQLKPVKLRPYLQGNLDSLCGIYALINAIRWALRNELASAKGPDWEELFRRLTNHAVKEMGHLDLPTSGLSLYAMIGLIHVARDYVSEELNVELLFRRPFAIKKPTDADQTSESISRHLQQSSTAALAAVYGKLNHWSVITAIDAKQAQLFDSERIKHLPITNLQPKEFVDRREQRSHVQPSNVILLKTLNSSQNNLEGQLKTRIDKRR
ncbi:hypothetical protein [Brucella pseudogrignonensis]|uniref:hypothetical protein n=1 Tax=Brucella pseudogrignonensis TaxID=419475 RepID=UPI000CFC4ED2|nr:hypothetical protein [Brucella pseudogrignonensis]MQP40963.1 hypothetical protein [Ochrobactrum sp. MYb237]PQZ40916.1 hypothetical protein CQ059_16845 [Brucella pseudogrignonensis]PRA40365.1 hypothetical protein CQ063_12310 [Brucella pseudogrignonensis]PRA68958.1 hypothetical protein CQ055_12195 [Brucella pseudogrignonensis]